MPARTHTFVIPTLPRPDAPRGQLVLINDETSIFGTAHAGAFEVGPIGGSYEYQDGGLYITIHTKPDTVSFNDVETAIRAALVNIQV